MSKLSQLFFPAPFASPDYASAKSAIGFNMIGFLAQGSVRLACSVLIARFSGAEALGKFNLGISIALFLTMFGPQACGAAASKFLAMARGSRAVDDVAEIARFISTLAFLGTTALAGSATLFSIGIIGSTWLHAISVGALVFSYSAYMLVRGVRNGLSQFRTNAAWDVVSSTISVALISLALILDATQFLLWPLVCGYGLAALAGWPKSGRRLTSHWNRDIVGFVAWSSVHVIAAGGLLPLITVIASQFVKVDRLGELAAAISLATPLGLLSIVVRTSLAPAISRMFASKDLAAIRAQVDLTMRALIFGLVPLFAILGLNAAAVIEIFFGSDFSEAADVFVVLLVGVSFTAFDAPFLRLHNTSQSRVRQLALINTAGLTVGVVAVLLTTPTYGVLGSAFGYACGTATSAIFSILLVWRIDRMNWSRLLFRLVSSYFLAALGFIVIDAFPSPATAAGISIAFVLVWLVISIEDSGTLRQIIRRVTPESPGQT